MRTRNDAFPEASLIANCILLAQTTFLQATPANADVLAPRVPAAPAEPIMQRLARWMNALEDWGYRQHVANREAYLAQAHDVFDLERRQRDLERRPYL
jgi:hypothetical protein